VFFIKIAKMTKITIIAILFLAVFASCQKDCEKDHTANLKVTNKSDIRAYLKLDAGDTPIDPGETSSFEIDLNLANTPELIYQAVVNYRWEGGGASPYLSQVVIYNQCKTTEVTIE